MQAATLSGPRLLGAEPVQRESSLVLRAPGRRKVRVAVQRLAVLHDVETLLGRVNLPVERTRRQEYEEHLEDDQDVVVACSMKVKKNHLRAEMLLKNAMDKD